MTNRLLALLREHGFGHAADDIDDGISKRFRRTGEDGQPVYLSIGDMASREPSAPAAQSETQSAAASRFDWLEVKK